ncbi:hypothetical protein KFK09_012858 [Dendrobium nobile]|uniref:Uncharacterized protein n=1 Tax=Dendrobium nobile TaxID=94219 RepID=A0A8T3BIW6_DENNO|nr:hypothetical protein KFK09_012858 [Dendrobium nobile]
MFSLRIKPCILSNKIKASFNISFMLCISKIHQFYEMEILTLGFEFYSSSSIEVKVLGT